MRVSWFIVLLLLLPLAFAQGADWVPFDLRQDWQRTSVGYCANDSQCLVSNSFNSTYDNIPDAYWDGLVNDSLGPKCINHGQFILDHYCSQGEWSSRTRLVAEQLLALALNYSPSDFALYCDDYTSALNRFNYSANYGNVEQFLSKNCLQTGLFFESATPCVNSVCALRFGNNVGFGTSLNVAVDSPNSFLQSLNLPPSACNSAINDDNDYDQCGGNVWYNWNTNSVLFLPGITNLNPPDQLVMDFFSTPYEKLYDYVFTNVHNPDVGHLDYSFFNATPDFSYVYMTKDVYDFAYGFKQENVTLSQVDYAGWYLSNIDLPVDTCRRFIKRFDPSARVSCEVQEVPTEFYVVANAVPPLPGFERKSIVDSWADLTGKLRVVS